MESTLLYHRLVVVICYNQSGRGERLASLLRPNKMRVEDGVHMAKEVWKDIPGYKGRYQASSMGRIKSVERKVYRKDPWGGDSSRHVAERILKPRTVSSGYRSVDLGVRNHQLVHRLVALTFLPHKKEQIVVNHKNGAKDDNRVENLEWLTVKENALHCRDVLLKTAGRRRTRVQCVETGEIFEYAQEAAACTGANAASISRIIHGDPRYKTSGGLHWKQIK